MDCDEDDQDKCDAEFQVNVVGLPMQRYVELVVGGEMVVAEAKRNDCEVVGHNVQWVVLRTIGCKCNALMPRQLVVMLP